MRNHIKTHKSNQWTADLGYPFELVETPEETWDSSVKIFKWSTESITWPSNNGSNTPDVKIFDAAENFD
ncbi:hypothetical protein Csa_005999 [Cucumis sativus]|uniref:Uncharacterized protein n=1 Tax=Cucumis sativus TaxID=3659 RepID=A0A0A0LJN4_CUCSA|nr:hypothetical protein Csa_005999 [Cucumis sativus]